MREREREKVCREAAKALFLKTSSPVNRQGALSSRLPRMSPEPQGFLRSLSALSTLALAFAFLSPWPSPS